MPTRPVIAPEKVGAKRKSGGAPQKYFLDDRGRKLIMDLYDGSTERTDLLQRHIPGVPRRVIQRWAYELGKVHSRDYWSPEQEKFLRENYNRLSLRKMERHLRKYRPTILKKLDEMGLTREDDGDGYTLTDLITGFGVGGNTVRKWIDKGWLKGRKVTTAFNHDAWHFTDEQVRNFMRNHPNEMNPHKFDWPWVHDIAFGGKSGAGRLDSQDRSEYAEDRRQS